MPEIKNTFDKGIMNKDLDERLVPSGQYRDAMNVQVSTSEDADVGTVQNILGNDRVETIVGPGFTCIGAISDEKKNVLYWFVTSDSADAIIEFHHDQTVTPILVDTNKDVLKFDVNSLITGISIIDDLLFWTDDINEPRRINITELKRNNHIDLTSHSDMFVEQQSSSIGPITESHITVIRKRPQKAPTVKLSETSLQPIYRTYYDPLPPNTTQQGFDLHGITTGSTNITFQQELQIITFNTAAPYAPGDIILLLRNDEIGNLPQTYDVKMKVTGPLVPIIIFGSIQLGWQVPYEVLEVEGNYQSSQYQLDIVKEVDVEPIFERELIRFGTRYKYSNGEYSAFSPFTQPVFFAGAFGFHPTRDPYNLAMENTILSLKLEDLVPADTPNDVTQVDILFKKERSTTIYSVDSIKINDPTPNYFNQSTSKTILKTSYPLAGATAQALSQHTEQYNYNTKGEYEVTVENIYAALPDNQILRPWDNVPRKALAQEITGNRVIYANYLQNYDLTDTTGNPTKPIINPDFENRHILGEQPVFSNSIGKRSIKSLRTYYLGIVYGDKYGRETPVFTSKDASINIPFDQDLGPLFNGTADKSLRLTASLQGSQPAWAHYFKYFIKQTTGEYYNLTLDRVYKASEDDNLWISFPSSDRNKIQEGDYFSIKKQVDVEQIVPVENKIKIIDIKNEAPETIKYEYISLGTGGGSATDLSALFPDPSAAPGAGVKRILIDKNAWESEGGLALEDLSKSDRLAVQFTITENGTIINSQKYFVSGFSVRDNGGDLQYNLVLRKVIEQTDDWVESSPGVLNSDDNLNITIYKLEQKDAVEFEGRFFVKIISNPVTQTYLVPSTSDTLNFATLAKAIFFNLRSPKGNHVSNPPVMGIFNTITTWSNSDFAALSPTVSVNASPGVMHNASEWADATKFGTPDKSSKKIFIDNTMFVAGQQLDTIDVRYSGKTWKGDQYKINQYVNGFEGIIAPNTTAGTATVSNSDDITSPYYITNNSGVAQGSRHFSTKVVNLLPGDFTNRNHLTNNYVGGTHFTTDDARAYQLTDGGGYFIHLSFMAPGVDLHDGNFTALGDKAFDKWTGTLLAPNVYGSNNPDKFYTDIFQLGLQKIKADSIYIDGAKNDMDGQWKFVNVPGAHQEYNAKYAADSTWAADSDNQWNPGYLNPAASSVINQLNVGARFKIVGDDLDEVYTIKRVTELRMYNHTSWNPSPRWKTTGGSPTQTGQLQAPSDNVYGDNSVATAMQALLTHVTNNPGAWNGSWTQWINFKERVKNFGKASNRRVTYVLQVDKNPLTQSTFGGYPFLTINASPPTGMADADESQVLRFVDNYIEPGSNTLPTSPAIFETEAKEEQDLNIYYEASDALPIRVETGTHLKGHLLGPVGSKVTSSVTGSIPNIAAANLINPTTDFHPRVAGWEGNIVEINNPGFVASAGNYINSTLTFWKEDGGYTTAKVLNIEQTVGSYITKFKIKQDTYKNKMGLSYYNCFSFGNGVESNRIRDDFNESFILNGVKASTVLEEPYEEERRKHGLIYSGLYNSTSGVNDLNQFIQAEKITKDLMPSYGSIQKLYARDKDLVTLCEDKVVQIFVDKDMLFNADGNTQLLSTNRVLGEAQPFRGNYGISKNPESFAAESFRAYFTDKQRGAVIRLSIDGITPISDAGMHDYFRDHLPVAQRLYGSYDSHKGDYNLSIIKGWRYDTPTSPTFTTFNMSGGSTTSTDIGTGGPGTGTGGVLTAGRTAAPSGGESAGPQRFGCTDQNASNYDPNATVDDGSCVYAAGSIDTVNVGTTVTYNEKSKGWVSFKSFLPEVAISSVNQYYSMVNGRLWKHHINQTRNTFYQGAYNTVPAFVESSITPLLNREPGLVKNFNTLNYEGTQSKIDQFTTITQGGVNWTDGDYYNLQGKPGWYVSSMNTDKQEGTLNEFIEKEGKWFNHIKGTAKNPLDTAAFNFQGLGMIDIVQVVGGGGGGPRPTEILGCTDPNATNYNPLATVDDGSCIIPTNPIIPGCMDPTATNYDPSATVDDGSCVYPAIVYGCTDPNATNYNVNATMDDGSCIYVINPGPGTGNETGPVDDGRDRGEDTEETPPAVTDDVAVENDEDIPPAEDREDREDYEG